MPTPIMPINVNEYKFFGFPPADKGDVILVQNKFYKIQQKEPLFYQLSNRNPAGAIIPWDPQLYQAIELIPPDNMIYYIQAFGILGNLEVNINIPQGNPHSSVDSRLQFMNNVMAPYDDPLTYKFTIKSGNTPSVDVNCLVGTIGSIWFYGWKFTVNEVTKPESYIELEDLIRQGRY